MNNEEEIIEALQKSFGSEVLAITPFPKPYFVDLKKVKAIYLGCDPSNQHSNNLPFAFALESKFPVFNKFISDHSSNLELVGLKWDDLYVQNLCQNYFRKETSKNLSVWIPATKIWIPLLKSELEKLNPDIPVLLTSSYLYNVLVLDKWKKLRPKQFYNCEINVPIPESDNLLERPLIPFYRNRRKVDYHLSNPEWKNYKSTIKNFIWGNYG